MNTLFILNDAPYGTERSYNGLRLARALSLDARGLRDEEVVEGARRSGLKALAEWTAQADKVLVF